MTSLYLHDQFYRNNHSVARIIHLCQPYSHKIIITALKRSLRRLCFHRYLSVHRGNLGLYMGRGLHPGGCLCQGDPPRQRPSQTRCECILRVKCVRWILFHCFSASGKEIQEPEIQVRRGWWRLLGQDEDEVFHQIYAWEQWRQSIVFIRQ